jgi:hypothetical protein
MKRRADRARGRARVNGAAAAIRVVDLNIIISEKTVLNER